jgi:hypothetical protein
MKAYVTCPVSLSDNRLNLLPEIENVLRSCGLDVFVFKIGGSPDNIFQRDYEQLELCDVIVAEVSEASHGVGIELGISHCLNHKIVLVFEKGKKVSALARGIPNAVLVEYENLEEMKKKLSEAFK